MTDTKTNSSVVTDPMLPIQIKRADGSITQRVLPASVHRRQHLGFVGSTIPNFMELAAGPRSDEGDWQFRTRRKPEWGFVNGGFDAQPGWLEAAEKRAKEHVDHGWEMSISYANRSEARGTMDAVSGGRLLWADDDHRDGINQKSRAFGALFPPHLVIHSGGGVHLAWKLDRFVTADQLAELQDRLALTVDGDPVAGKISSVLRLAGTRNGKYPDTWSRVVHLAVGQTPWNVEQIERELESKPKPKPYVPKRRRPVETSSFEQAREVARQIAPEEYFAALAPGLMDGYNPRNGMVTCPHPDHEDRTPSCKVFPDPGQGWKCFGGNCPIQAGGDIYDLAAVLEFGIKARGLDGKTFKDLAQRVHKQLNISND